MQESCERIIISLDPEFNPSGRKHPNTIKREMKADPDFQELSSEEQETLLAKADNMIQSSDDITKYGTLQEMVDEASLWGHGSIRFQKNLIVSLNSINDRLKGEGFLERPYKDGCVLNQGEVIAKLEVNDNDYPSFSYLYLWNMIMPFTGRVFALTEFDNIVGHYKHWHEDLFIIGNITDTREDAIEWYKKTTGKIPTYKTPEEIEKEKQASDRKVNKLANKWGL